MAVSTTRLAAKGVTVGFTRVCQIQDSSAISALEYNPNSQKMRVYFPGNNTIWEYSNVAPPVFGAVIGAASIGTAFNTYVKGSCPGVRIFPPAESADETTI